MEVRFSNCWPWPHDQGIFPEMVASTESGQKPSTRENFNLVEIAMQENRRRVNTRILTQSRNLREGKFISVVRSVARIDPNHGIAGPENVALSVDAVTRLEKIAEEELGALSDA